MITAHEYRQFARQCLLWSLEAETADTEAAFVSLARDWELAALAANAQAKSKAHYGIARTAAFRSARHTSWKRMGGQF
jgi:hypothetical protein